MKLWPGIAQVAANLTSSLTPSLADRRFLGTSPDPDAANDLDGSDDANKAWLHWHSPWAGLSPSRLAYWPLRIGFAQRPQGGSAVRNSNQVPLTVNAGK